jgi:hypothetical protein
MPVDPSYNSFSNYIKQMKETKDQNGNKQTTLQLLNLPEVQQQANYTSHA